MESNFRPTGRQKAAMAKLASLLKELGFVLAPLRERSRKHKDEFIAVHPLHGQLSALLVRFCHPGRPYAVALQLLENPQAAFFGSQRDDLVRRMDGDLLMVLEPYNKNESRVPNVRWHYFVHSLALADLYCLYPELR